VTKIHLQRGDGAKERNVVDVIKGGRGSRRMAMTQMVVHHFVTGFSLEDSTLMSAHQVVKGCCS
jgi:hypothetical protein